METFEFLGDLSDDPPADLLYAGGYVMRNGELCIERHMLRMAVWELCELNFRSEMVILDQIMASEEWDKDGKGRMAYILQCFPKGQI